MTSDYPKEFLTEQEAAEYINMSVKTLRRWRFDRRGPNYAKIAGKSIRYPISELQDWINRQMVAHD
jgi:excisionase family DNA binding protein